MNREAIISKYISTPAGRAKLAAAMVQPLRTTLDYDSGIENSTEYIQHSISIYCGYAWTGGRVDITDQGMRAYMIKYIQRYKKFDNLRTVLIKDYPEYVGVLDKLAVLK